MRTEHIMFPTIACLHYLRLTGVTGRVQLLVLQRFATKVLLSLFLCISVTAGWLCSLKIANYSLKVNSATHINAFTPSRWLRDRWAWIEMERWEGRNLLTALSPQLVYEGDLVLNVCVCVFVCGEIATSPSTLISIPCKQCKDTGTLCARGPAESS